MTKLEKDLIDLLSEVISQYTNLAVHAHSLCESFRPGGPDTLTCVFRVKNDIQNGLALISKIDGEFTETFKRVFPHGPPAEA